MTTIDDMQKHIETLCERHVIDRRPINLSPHGSGKACAILETREIFVGPVRSIFSYLTALHEIGHILGRHQSSERETVKERWAWRWAEKNALVWSPPMAKRAAYFEALATGAPSRYVENSTT